MSWFHLNLQDVAQSFLSILFEGIPFLLLGAIISGIIEAFVPSSLMLRLLPKRPVPAILVSGLLGLIFPICECGSVVVVRRFIRKGIPVSSALTYMLAAPIVSPVVALSTWAAFKGQSAGTMVSFRLIIGFLLAVSVGFIVQRLRPESVLKDGIRPPAHPPEPAHDHHHDHHDCCGHDHAEEALDAHPATASPASAPFRQKLGVALQSATADFLDVAFFLVIGAAITAFANTAIDRAVIDPVASHGTWSVLAMMALAFLLALCSTTDAFIAASLIKFPFVAQLAFLLFGPLLDVKLVFLYSAVFRKRFVLGLSVGLFLVIAFICTRLQILHL